MLSRCFILLLEAMFWTKFINNKKWNSVNFAFRDQKHNTATIFFFDMYIKVMTTEKKISLLWHEMSFLLCMKNFKTIFENFTKSSPTNPIFWPHLPKILGFLVCAL